MIPWWRCQNRLFWVFVCVTFLRILLTEKVWFLIIIMIRSSSNPDRFIFGVWSWQGPAHGLDTLGVHHAQRQPGDGTGGQGDAGGHDQVPHVALGVQVGDGHALVGPSVVAGEGWVNNSKLGYPGGAVHTGRVATTLEKVYSQRNLTLFQLCANIQRGQSEP